jgi:hypothetical protein
VPVALCLFQLASLSVRGSVFPPRMRAVRMGIRLPPQSNYVGRVVSYTDPDITRPGHGLVGKYIPGEGYNVQFKFIDDLEPQDSEQHCTQDWIEDHLVDAETVRAWTTAVKQQNKKEAPLERKRIRGHLFFYSIIICIPNIHYHCS